MKTLILSTVAAAAIALSTGAALANDASRDNGFAVYQQSQSVAPTARTAADYPVGTDNGFAVYQQNVGIAAPANFLSASATNDDHVFSNNGRDAVEFRKAQQGR
jgi:hypothetical protein